MCWAPSDCRRAGVGVESAAGGALGRACGPSSTPRGCSPSTLPPPCPTWVPSGRSHLWRWSSHRTRMWHLSFYPKSLLPAELSSLLKKDTGLVKTTALCDRRSEAPITERVVADGTPQGVTPLGCLTSHSSRLGPPLSWHPLPAGTPPCWDLVEGNLGKDSHSSLGLRGAHR